MIFIQVHVIGPYHVKITELFDLFSGVSSSVQLEQWWPNTQVIELATYKLIYYIVWQYCGPIPIMRLFLKAFLCFAISAVRSNFVVATIAQPESTTAGTSSRHNSKISQMFHCLARLDCPGTWFIKMNICPLPPVFEHFAELPIDQYGMTGQADCRIYSGWQCHLQELTRWSFADAQYDITMRRRHRSADPS